uniref:Uncharacterized protein n=1 Tax=Anguilla anguilla TaxID=7936 RepID=A0A0E9VBD1_ANGAN
MMKDDFWPYHFFPHLCRPVPIVFAPLNSQMCIRLSNRGVYAPKTYNNIPLHVVVNGLADTA